LIRYYFVGVGIKRSTLSRLVIFFWENWNACIVAATASDAAPLQFLASYAGATVGEFIRDALQIKNRAVILR